MNIIKTHLNWSYGIALIIGLVCATLAVVLNIWMLAIVLLIAIYIGGELVLWAKSKRTIPTLLRLIPPIYAIVVLCLKNKK